jgi:outer membrane murein-binding lipoprotein Lpp
MSKPVEWEDVLLGIRHHLDDGTSERKEVSDRLLAVEKEMKRRGSRGSPGFARYLIAICIGVAATLAWQSYGEDLGWSPEVKQMIAGWVQQVGWTKPGTGPESTAVQPSVPETQVATVVQTLPAAVVPKAATASSIDPEQVHQIAEDLVALRQTVDQLAASQDQMAHQIETLQTSNQQILTSNQEILEKIPAPPPPPPPVAPTHKPATRQPTR